MRSFLVAFAVCLVVLGQACGGEGGATPPEAGDSALDLGDVADDGITADAGASDGSDAGAGTDAPDSLDASDGPTDPEAAAAMARAAIEALGLDPADGREVRQVWEDSDTYLAYLAQFEAISGETFLPGGAMPKGECLHLAAFEPAIPYCGPGCGNDVTVAPPCLNQACFVHDVCYAAYECASGNAIDVSLSFGPLMVCCDAPLNTIWGECVVSVAADFLAGRIGASDVALFNAISGLMFVMNNVSVLDAPTDLQPSDCSHTFEDACAEPVFVVTVTPDEITEAGGTAELCATLHRGDVPVGRWTLTAATAGPGSLGATEVLNDGGEHACVTYVAPDPLPESDDVVIVSLRALATGQELAASAANVVLSPAPGTLTAQGRTSMDVVANGPSAMLCFVARRGDDPAPGVEVAFAFAGSGFVDRASASTDEAGVACVSYSPPGSVPDVVDVLTASAEIGGRSLTATIAITVLPIPRASLVGRGGRLRLAAVTDYRSDFGAALERTILYSAELAAPSLPAVFESRLSDSAEYTMPTDSGSLSSSAESVTDAFDIDAAGVLVGGTLHGVVDCSLTYTESTLGTCNGVPSNPCDLALAQGVYEGSFRIRLEVPHRLIVTSTLTTSGFGGGDGLNGSFARVIVSVGDDRTTREESGGGFESEPVSVPFDIDQVIPAGEHWVDIFLSTNCSTSSPFSPSPQSWTGEVDLTFSLAPVSE